MLLLGCVGSVAGACTCFMPRTFADEERARLETQYGPEWWRALGLIPGPATPGDYVERPFGDSSISAYSPRRFWEPRPCTPAAHPRDPRGRRSTE